MLTGHVSDFLFAAQVAGQAEPVATHFWLQEGRPFGHFTMLAQGIDRMFATGKPSWPVERTLLTTGILDAALTSRFEKQKRHPVAGAERVADVGQRELDRASACPA